MASQSDHPVALITGTSTGIGLALALRAATAGWRVVATVRREGSDSALLQAAKLAGVEIDVRLVDVTDAAAAAETVDAVAATYGRIDAVVNNAGAGHVGTVEEDSLDTIRRVMEVNYFGVVNVTKPAMAHLRASEGVLVTVTSVGGVVGQPFSESYCAAKFAVEGMMESLHPVAETVGVRVVVVEPGPVATSFVENVGASSAAVASSTGPYSEAFARYLARSRDTFANAQSAEGVAEVVFGAMTDENPPFRLQTSPGATAFTATKLTDLDGAAVTALTSSWIA